MIINPEIVLLTLESLIKPFPPEEIMSEESSAFHSQDDNEERD